MPAQFCAVPDRCRRDPEIPVSPVHPSRVDPETRNVNQLIKQLRLHHRLFVLTGAGCSTGSGIPDYRTPEGHWKPAPPVQHQDFLRSETARQRYWARSMAGWPRFAAARPNPAHHALAALEKIGRISRIVTQNVDGLHQKAGSGAVIDLHGRLNRVICLGCGHRVSRQDLQFRLQDQNPGLSGLCGHRLAPDGDAEIADTLARRLKVPDCEICGGTLKPDVVLFGDNVPTIRVQKALQALQCAEALLVVGSSLSVFSGYRFCKAARSHGLPIYIINHGRTRADGEVTTKVDGECGAVLTRIVGRLDRN